MTELEEKRVQWHLKVAVCRTLRGIRTHLSLISFDDLRLLMRFFGCELGEIDYRMYHGIKGF